MKNPHVLQVSELTRIYRSGESELTVLDRITFSVEAGIRCAITGPSGSGKTTLLGLCAGLDRPSAGEVRFKNQALGELSEEELAEVRNRSVGFIFQSFQLIPTLTALENVMVPVELQGMNYREAREKAVRLLAATGLEKRTSHYPAQLSGGEQQRVAIARAFINDPDLLFADEPTGNLDGDTSRQVEELLFDLNRRKGTTLIIVTHDLELAAKCDRIIGLRQGVIDSDVRSEPSLQSARE